MTESPNQFKQTFPTEPPPYPGHIRFQKRKNGLYASHVKNTYKRNRKVYHDYDYLGKVIDQENLLFYHTKKGFFNFSLEKGYIPRPDLSLKIYSSERESLRYGDIWVFDDIITKSGLLSVFKIVTPGDTDTLLTLVAYKLSNPGQPFDNIAHWYDRSFAQIKYPNAIVSSSDISKYLHKLGQDLNHQDFTVHYLNIMSQYNQFNGLKEFPVLIDSSVLPTKIDIPLTAVSNHNGLINNKVRLIYVFDQKSGLPIFFNAIPRFIIDNSTLKHTINTLQANEIDIKFIIMDAGYSSEQNLIFLNKLHIPYITRMNANKTVFRDIVLNHGSDIDKAQYAVEYNGRFLHCKKIPYVIKDYQYYAYLIKDIDQLSTDTINYYQKYLKEPNGIDIIEEKKDYLAKFVLLSNKDFDESNILNLYYTRFGIDQIFDTTQGNESMIPGRVHSFESLKGHLTISFLATVISSLINNLLKGSKFCSADVFSILRELDIDIYENTKIVRVPVRTEKDIISLLQLKCPFEIETSKLKSSYLNSLGKRRKVGRPRGNENKPKEVIQASDSGRHPLDSSSEINPKKRGRPPKPRSTTPSVGTSDTVRNYTPKTRGRKKGYENKPKEAVQVKDDKNNS